MREYLEGGRNDGVVRRVGRVKLVPIVLKRGMFVVSSRGGANSSGGGANAPVTMPARSSGTGSLAW